MKEKATKGTDTKNEKPRMNQLQGFNLRSRAMCLHFDSQNLHLVGVRNNINQLLYKGWESLSDFEGRTDEEIQDFIEDFLSRMNLKRADAFMLLPRSEVITQIVDFPAEAANNLEEVMEYQLVNYFALDQEEYQFFPQIVGRGEQLKVLIIAIKKARLGHAFGMIRRWDMKLAGLSLDTLGLINGLLRLDNESLGTGQVVIFRSFPNGIEMIGLRESRLVLTHYIPLHREGVEATADAEEEGLELEVCEPEIQAETGIDLHALNSGIEGGFSQARMDPNSVSRYIWVGDYQLDVRAYLEDEASIPFDSLTDGSGATIPDGALVGFGGATCAVHDQVPFGLNMLPEKQRSRHKRLPVIIASAVAVLIMLFFVFSEAKDYMDLKAENQRLQTRSQQFQKAMGEVASARAELEAKQSELTLYSKFQANKVLLRIVDALAHELPEDTYLSSMTVKRGNELSIQGESGQPFDVQRILTKMPFLTDVKSSDAITTGRNKDGKRRFNYQATIKLEDMK